MGTLTIADRQHGFGARNRLFEGRAARCVDCCLSTRCQESVIPGQILKTDILQATSKTGTLPCLSKTTLKAKVAVPVAIPAKVLTAATSSASLSTLRLRLNGRDIRPTKKFVLTKNRRSRLANDCDIPGRLRHCTADHGTVSPRADPRAKPHSPLQPQCPQNERKTYLVTNHGNELSDVL